MTAVGTPPDVVDGLAPAPRPGPDTPVRDLGADVRGRPSLELAVVPFTQVRIDDGVREAGQAGGLGGPRSRTREHEGEMVSAPAEDRGPRPAAALVGQRDVAAAGVPSGLRPLGLPVADEPDLAFRRGVAHRVASGRTRLLGVPRRTRAAPSRRPMRAAGSAASRSWCCTDRPGRCRARGGRRSSPRAARSRSAGRGRSAATSRPDTPRRLRTVSGPRPR